MADLRGLPAAYVEGDRWPPGDFNAIARGSLAYDQNWQREHGDDPTGEHDSRRIAYAGGMIVFAGGTTYTYAQSSHIASVTRISAGLVEIKVDFAFRAPGKWSAIVWGEAPETTTAGKSPVERDTAKSTDTVRIQLAGGVDQDFYFFAFGVK